MEELWEVLDDKGIKTGKMMKKEDERNFKKDFYHLGADVWIINSENKILIQKRSKTKRLAPNVWAMTGGSTIAGENSLETVVREAKEELGIDIDIHKLKLLDKIKIASDHLYIDTYILRADYDIEKMRLQDEEVSDVKWASWNEIDDLVISGKFIKNRWEFVKNMLR